VLVKEIVFGKDEQKFGGTFLAVHSVVVVHGM